MKARSRTAPRIAVFAVLAPLSAAATVGLIRPQSLPTVTADPVAAQAIVAQLPVTAPPVSVPDRNYPFPASISAAKRTPVASAGAGVVVSNVAEFAEQNVPNRAISAYQLSASVMASADASCNLPWQIIAAIGAVESDHGRYAGSSVDEDGVTSPAILGPRLTGRDATRRIADTDGGLLDGDIYLDRAVGPMQFIPSTWAIVGVDGDGDGRRDPQDIDDAALATGVYLCSGQEDLSQVEGLRAAVFRYNHSEAYVDHVLAIAESYLTSQLGILTSTGPALLNTRLVAPFTAEPTDYLDPEEIATTLTAEPTAAATTLATPAATAIATPTPTRSPDPTTQPTTQPTSQPTSRPTSRPTSDPTTGATPTTGPTTRPTVRPTVTATDEPTPTHTPTAIPTTDPTVSPRLTPEPTAGPSTGPTTAPTSGPTTGPTSGPTSGPETEKSNTPEPTPTEVPATVEPSAETTAPAPEPTPEPTVPTSTLTQAQIDRYLPVFQQCQGSGLVAQCMAELLQVDPLAEPAIADFMAAMQSLPAGQSKPTAAGRRRCRSRVKRRA